MFTILQIRKSTRKKPIGKTNQQGLETGYQMPKGPDLHYAQHSLTHLINTKFNNIVNIDMQRAKKTPLPLNTVVAVKILGN